MEEKQRLTYVTWVGKMKKGIFKENDMPDVGDKSMVIKAHIDEDRYCVFFGGHTDCRNYYLLSVHIRPAGSGHPNSRSTVRVKAHGNAMQEMVMVPVNYRRINIDTVRLLFLAHADKALRSQNRVKGIINERLEDLDGTLLV